MASAPRVDDYAQLFATLNRLHSVGARLGARTLIFNAELAAQRQAAQVRDLAKGPAFGRRVEAAEHLHPANDYQPTTPEQPTAPAGGGL